jgi:hypothetical protein
MEGIGWSIRAFLPESSELLYVQAGLLTYPGFLKPSHPPAGGQWQVFQKTLIPHKAGSGITAAGTVADSDRIPFSSQRFYFVATPLRFKDNLIFRCMELLFRSF